MRTVALIVAVIMVLGALGIVTVADRLLGLRADLSGERGADEKRTILVGGLRRNYLLHVPADLPAGKPAPLVLVLHGGGGHDWNMPGFTHFDELADQQGFLVAYPDAVNGYWNASRNTSTADDVGFIRALIDEVARAHSLELRRVYSTGISNGGFFTNRLACDLGDKIAAIASVAATMPESLAVACKPSRAISVMYIQGTEDPLVPINGGKVGFRRGRSYGESISLADAEAFWCKNDRIRSTSTATDLPDHASDGTHVHREIWSGGADDTEIVVYTIEGGGHTWPGGPQYLPKLVVGKASQNLNATRTIWEFFKTQVLP
ncbi:MAG TPA: PHB depolymerase family esterase [Candidatus Acidoferrales bacterium]